MADVISSRQGSTQIVERITSTPRESSDTLNVGRPSEQLEIDDTPPGTDEVVYPTGPKLYLALAALYTAAFLNGLDLTIVAVAVPRLTDYFKKIDDIGWYSAAYGLTASAFRPFLGKACTIISPKTVALVGLCIFLLGSIICTFATSSPVFIVGRAMAGLGTSALSAGGMTLIAHMFPSHKRSLWIGLSGMTQAIGLSCAPLLGGVLIDAFSWRACFGINIPLCPLAILFTAWCVEDPTPPSEGIRSLSSWQKLLQMDPVGTLFLVPAITCLLLGLQWGGIQYGWLNAKIIVLILLALVLIGIFSYLQHRLGEQATFPPRIMKNRNVLGAAWFSACANGVMAVTEAYISIYWQGVRGETPTQSGLLCLSLIVCLMIASFTAAFGVPLVGYFTPFMFATSIIAPIALGLLTEITINDSKLKIVSLTGLLGFACGLGLGMPSLAVSIILPPNEISLGTSLCGVGGGLGAALFISAAATLFQGRLDVELAGVSHGLNTTIDIAHAGLSDIRSLIGEDRLQEVLSGYNTAAVQTLYMPLALALLSFIGSFAMEWTSVKKKRS